MIPPNFFASSRQHQPRPQSINKLSEMERFNPKRVFSTHENDIDTELKLFHENISQPFDDADTIHDCGCAALSILQFYPDESLRLAHSRLHAYPFRDVPACWRRLYCEASLWKAYMTLRDLLLKQSVSSEILETSLSAIVSTLDMCLIMSGASERHDLVQRLIEMIAGALQSDCVNDKHRDKKRKTGEHSKANNAFSSFTPSESPRLSHPISRKTNFSLPSFQTYLTTSRKQNKVDGPRPLILSEAASNWPAITDRLWSDPSYLLSTAAKGYRIVPVEVGSAYTDDDWGQKLMPFGKFLEKYMLQNTKEKGYLAQHDLFDQIPALMRDICTPDYCYSRPEASSETDDDEEEEPESGIRLNMWMGSAHTVSPAHTDPHHNIFVQVVGYKYVRLFPPSASMFPVGTQNGIDMSNTTQVDVAEAMRVFEGWKGWDGHDVKDKDPIECEMDDNELREEFLERWPDFDKAKFEEGILGPGDCLYIPKGWWHYVRSLSPSISVSFWWN
jgi:hypothetical protein